MSEWIKTKDALPAYGDPVAIKVPWLRGAIIGWRQSTDKHGERWGFDDAFSPPPSWLKKTQVGALGAAYCVTHWMRLPEPPRD